VKVKIYLKILQVHSLKTFCIMNITHNIGLDFIKINFFLNSLVYLFNSFFMITPFKVMKIYTTCFED